MGRQSVLKEIGILSRKSKDDTVTPRRLDREFVTKSDKQHVRGSLAIANTNAFLFQKSAISPFGLLEELFSQHPWRLLLSTIMLNRTTRVQVDVVLYEFLRKWPDATSASLADELEVADVIYPMGMRFRRARGIIRFSQEWLELLTKKASLREHKKNAVLDEAFSLAREDVLGLYYCGDYAYDAYRIFVQGSLDAITTDHALQIYVDYHRGLDKAGHSNAPFCRA